MADTEHSILNFIYHRLVNVHHENPDVDYMRKLASILPDSNPIVDLNETVLRCPRCGDYRVKIILPRRAIYG